MDQPMKSLRINFDPTVQQPKSWAAQISKLPGGGRTTELRIHICRFDDEKGQCFDLGACTVYRSLHQFTPRFTICSTHKGHSQNAILLSLNVTLLSTSGAPTDLIERAVNRLLMLGPLSLTAPLQQNLRFQTLVLREIPAT